MSGVIALVGGLVDVAAPLTQFRFELSSTDQTQLRNLAATIASIRTDLMNRRIPASIQFNPNDQPWRGVPLLLEMEKTVTLISQVVAGSRSMHEYAPPSDNIPRSELVVSDALTHPQHLKFALKRSLPTTL